LFPFCFPGFLNNFLWDFFSFPSLFLRVLLIFLLISFFYFFSFSFSISLACGAALGADRVPPDVVCGGHVMHDGLEQMA